MAILTTRRLILTPPTAADLPHIVDLRRDESVVRFTGGRLGTQEECWARLLKFAGHWSWFGYGYWMVREASTGRFAGEIGISHQRRANLPDDRDDPETGWALLPWARGQGYAKEALAAMLSWSEHHLRITRTVCMIAPENRASVGLATANGYRLYGETSVDGCRMDVFERNVHDQRT